VYSLKRALYFSEKSLSFSKERYIYTGKNPLFSKEPHIHTEKTQSFNPKRAIHFQKSAISILKKTVVSKRAIYSY